MQSIFFNAVAIKPMALSNHSKRAIARRILRMPYSPSSSGSSRGFFSKRGFGRPFRDDSKTQNRVLFGIIGLNVAVFTGWQVAKRSYDRQLYSMMINHFTVSPLGVFRHGYLHTLATAVFSHQDMWHLLMNMITFYSFAGPAIAVLGTSSFLTLYLGGGLLSSAATVLWPYVIPYSWPASRSHGFGTRSLGASGAVNALVAWNILKGPGTTVLLYGVLPMPLAVFGLMFIGIDAVGLYYGDTAVGNSAHLSGAAFGALYFLMRRRPPPGSFYRRY